MPAPAPTFSFWFNQWLAPVMGLTWFIALEVYYRWPVVGFIVIGGLVILDILILWSTRHRWPHPWSSLLGTGLLILTSAAAGSFFTTSLSRHSLAFVSAALIMMSLTVPATWFVASQRGRVALLRMTVSLWLGWVTLLSLSIFLSWPVWLLATLAAGLTAAVAAVTWIDGGVPATTMKLALWLVGWLGLELFIVSWALPTSIFVGSVIATVTIMLWLQFSRHVWLHTWQADRGRRYLLVGTVVIMVVLLTARWI